MSQGVPPAPHGAGAGPEVPVARVPAAGVDGWPQVAAREPAVMCTSSPGQAGSAQARRQFRDLDLGEMEQPLVQLSVRYMFVMVTSAGVQFLPSHLLGQREDRPIVPLAIAVLARLTHRLVHHATSGGPDDLRRRRRRPEREDAWSPGSVEESCRVSPGGGSRCTRGQPRRSPARPAAR